MQLKLSSRLLDGVFVIDCNGRIVFGEEAGALREFVKTALAQHKQIVLSLKNVSYIDSGGLGTMMTSLSPRVRKARHISCPTLSSPQIKAEEPSRLRSRQ